MTLNQYGEQKGYLPILNKNNKLSGLMEGKIREVKGKNIVIKARSTIKFIFQILIGIQLYIIVLGSLMIFKIDASFYVHFLMTSILICAVAISISITLYIFYPLIAPRIFDFRLGVFYTKPLSFYIHIMLWDSIEIISLENIKAVRILRILKNNGNKTTTIDQTSLILRDEKSIALTIRKNAPFQEIKDDAEMLAEKFHVRMIDAGTTTI